MFSLANDIRAAWSQYSTHLQRGGARQALPPPKPRLFLEYLHASSLGYCNLQKAYEVFKEEADYPSLLKENNSQKGWLLESGTRQAEKLQEAMLFAYGAAVSIEHDLVYHAASIAGRCDILYTTPSGHKYVIELKDAEGQAYRSIGEPRYSYLTQVITYMNLSEATGGAIVTMSKWGFNVYDVVLEGNLWFVYFNGQRYSPFIKNRENWNVGVSLREVGELFEELSETYDDVRNQRLITPPIVDPLNDDMGWLCVNQPEKPNRKTGKKGKAYANCPWVRRCHGLSLEFETEYDGDYIIVP